MIPVEIITALGSAALGGFTRIISNNQQLLKDKIDGEIKIAQAKSKFFDAAAERNRGKASFLQTIVGVTIALCCFGGIVLVALLGIPQSVPVVEPMKEALWGLFSWGGKTEIVQTIGLYIPEYWHLAVTSLIGFLFGSSVTKLR